MAKTLTYTISIKGAEQQVNQLSQVEAELKRINVERNALIKKQSQGNTLTAQETAKINNLTTASKDLGQQKKALNSTINNEIKSTKAAAGSYSALTATIARDRKALKDLEDPLGKNKTKFDNLTKSIKSNNDQLKKIDAATGNYQRNVGNYSGGIKNAMKTIGFAVAGVTAGVAILNKVFGSSIKVQKEFEFQMSKVKAIAQPTSKEFKSLEKDALRLGAATEKTAADVGKLQEELARRGFKTDDILAATEDILNLSTASDAALGDAARVTAQTLNQFGLAATETKDVTDVMAAAFANSALDLSKFDVAMQKAAPVAKTYGFAIEDTTAFIGRLTDVGLDASTAGTSFRNILLNLADTNGALAQKLGRTVTNGKDLNAALIELRNKGVDLNDTLQLTDKRSVAAFNAMLDGAEKTDVLIDKLNNAEGAAAQMADVMRDNLKGDTDKAKSALTGLGITIGSKLNPSLRDATQAFTAIVSSVNEWAAASAADEIFAERNEVGLLAAELKEGNTSEARRVEIIKELNNISPDLVEGLDAENLSYDQLNKNLEQYNNLATERVLLAGVSEDEAKAIAEQAETTRSSIEAEVALRQTLKDLYGTQIQDGLTLEENVQNILAANEDVFKAQSKQSKNIFVQSAQQAGATAETQNAEYQNLLKLRTAYGVVTEIRSKQTEAEKATLAFQEKSANIRSQLIERENGALNDLNLRELSTAKVAKLEQDILDINGKFRSEVQNDILKQAKAELVLREQFDKAVKFGIIAQGEAYRELTDGEIARLNGFLEKTAKAVTDVGTAGSKSAKQIKEDFNSKILPTLNTISRMLKQASEKKTLIPVELEEEIVDEDALDATVASFANTVGGSLSILKAKFDSGIIDAEEYQKAISGIFEPEKQRTAIGEFISSFDKLKELLSNKEGIDPESFKIQFQDSFEGIANAALEVANIVGSVFDNIYEAQNNRQQQEVDDYEKSQQKQRDALAKRLDSGLIEQAAYDDQIAVLDENLAVKQRKLEHDAAIRQKKSAIFSAAVNGAGVLLNAAMTIPFLPNGLIATAVAAGLVGTQIAAIASAPIPELATGGYMVGGSGTWNADDVPAWLSSGEAVINARVLGLNDNVTLSGTPFEIASNLNSYKGLGKRFATGGVVAPTITSSREIQKVNEVNNNMLNFADMIINGINDKQVINNAGETAAVQSRINVINNAGDF